ncbi:MAG: hypothetical protein AAB972_00190 [Patescibacteria group bacterium]
MRKAILIIGGCFALLLVSSLLVTPESILKPYYNVRYHWSHLPTQSVLSLDTEIFEKFNHSDSSGSYNYGKDINFLYGSRHNQSANTYYYRFVNRGQYSLCVTSQGFAHLSGNSTMRLATGETKYLVLKDNRPPEQRSYRLYFYEACGWVSYSGGGLEITVPSE